MKRWPLKKAYFWETAPFFRILLPFIAGILCYDRGWLPSIPDGYFIVIIFVAFFLYLSLVYTKKGNNRLPAITFLLLCIMLFSGGVAVSWFGDIRNNKTWFGNNISNSGTYLARITDAPIEKEHSWKLPVTLISSVNTGKVSPVTGNAFIYLYKDQFPMMLHKGDSILVPGKWTPIKNAGNPFEFDYVTYCRRNGLFYLQSCSVNDIRLYSANNQDGNSFIERAHDLCMRQLDKYIPDPKTKGLIQAMILGDEVNLDEDLRQSYAETGIVHIIAISGGNVAIFFIVISFLLWWLRHKKHLWIKYAVALPLVWFYVLMAGAAPSAVRAAVMFSLLAFSIMLEKNNNSLNQLFATAFLLLCAQPMWLFSVGFQLSFVAVLSLILFYTPVYKWVSPVNKPAKLLWGTVAASIAAEALVAPLVIYYFHTFPLLFIIANAAAYLFMSIVLVLGMVLIVLSFIPAVATIIGICVTGIVTVFDKIVVWLQNFNPESFHFLMLTGLELFLVYVMITSIVLFLLKKQKPALFTGLGAACLLLCSFCGDEWSRLHQQRFVVYNTAKVNHIELIKSDSYTIINTDTAARKKTGYAVKPAHTNWQAWKKNTTVANEILVTKGKTILLLNNNINADDSFPVDILVINYTGNIDLHRLHKVFSPSLLIIGNNYTEKQQEKWAKECAIEGISVHSVVQDGAFVF